MTSPLPARAGRADLRSASAVFAGATVLLGMGLLRGWQLADEGVFYAHFLRIFEGQLPYRDFDDGYAPLGLHLGAWLFHLGGVSLIPVRIGFVLVSAATAALLYAVARRFAGPAVALLPAALFVLAEPADAGAGATFHLDPYPAWPALTAVVATTWALFRALETARPQARRGWIFAAGVAAGTAFLCKQNVGLFALAGIFTSLAADPERFGGDGAAAGPAGGEGSRLARVAAVALLPLAVLVLVRASLSPAIVALFVVPVGAVSAAALLRARSSAGSFAGPVLLATSGFAAAVVPWAAFYLANVPLRTIAFHMFFLGRPVEESLRAAIPSPGLLAVPVVALFAAGAASFARWPRPLARLATLLATTAAILAFFLLVSRHSAAALHLPRIAARAGAGPAAAVLATSGMLDLFSVWIPPLLLLAAGALLLRRSAADPHVSALALLAGTAFLTLYPRVDFPHVATAAPLVAVLAVALLPAVPAERARRAATAALAVFALVFLAVKGASRAAIFLRPSGRGLAPHETLAVAFPRAPIRLPVYDARHRERTAAFLDVARFVDAEVPKDAGLFTWPALSMLNFLTGRRNPSRIDYFFGPMVDDSAQAEILAALDSANVPLVVLLDDPKDQFVAGSRPHAGRLLAGLAERYAEERRFGPYVVMRRR